MTNLDIKVVSLRTISLKRLIMSKIVRGKIYLVKNYANEITGSKLPSNLQVLKTLFFNIRVVKLSVRDSARLVIREVMIFWEKARIPTRIEKNCIEKVMDLYEEWRVLQKHAGRKTISHKQREEQFTAKFDNLFDIAHNDALKLINIEDDKQFLINQRKNGRVGFMYGIDYNNLRQEEEFIVRENRKSMQSKF